MKFGLTSKDGFFVRVDSELMLLELILMMMMMISASTRTEEMCSRWVWNFHIFSLQIFPLNLFLLVVIPGLDGLFWPRLLLLLLVMVMVFLTAPIFGPATVARPRTPFPVSWPRPLWPFRRSMVMISGTRPPSFARPRPWPPSTSFTRSTPFSSVFLFAAISRPRPWPRPLRPLPIPWPRSRPPTPFSRPRPSPSIPRPRPPSIAWPRPSTTITRPRSRPPARPRPWPRPRILIRTASAPSQHPHQGIHGRRHQTLGLFDLAHGLLDLPLRGLVGLILGLGDGLVGMSDLDPGAAQLTVIHLKGLDHGLLLVEFDHRVLDGVILPRAVPKSNINAG